MRFKENMKVHYAPNYEGAKTENGIVKRPHPDTPFERTFVVYNCGEDWVHYANYTAALTNNRDLKIGWKAPKEGESDETK